MNVELNDHSDKKSIARFCKLSKKLLKNFFN
jgi:hypothetical protein